MLVSGEGSLLADSNLLTVFHCACALLVSLPLLIRALVLSDYNPTFRASFNLNYVLKIFKYNYTGVIALT